LVVVYRNIGFKNNFAYSFENRIKIGNGQISYEEFSKVMSENFYRKFTSDEVREAFNQFDRDKSGNSLLFLKLTYRMSRTF